MKRYIVAMSFSRDQCIDRFDHVSKELNTHIMECIIYKDIMPEVLNHWCQEIGAWMEYANGTKCKSKLKEEDYLEHLFGEFGDEVHDAKFNLALYQIDNRKQLKKHSDDAYPDFEVTDELAKDLARFYESIVDVALPILVSGQKLSANEWAKKVRELI